MPTPKFSPVFQAFFHLLAKLRIDQSLTLKQLAARAGVHWTSIRRIEGMQCNPRLGIIGKIADALGYDLYDLFVMAREDVARLEKKRRRELKEVAIKNLAGRRHD